MAFTTGKDRFARRSAATYAADTLAAYLQGRERAYAVHDALQELRALFHEGAIIPCRLVLDGLAHPDEDVRAVLFTEAMQMIERQARSDTD